MRVPISASVSMYWRVARETIAPSGCSKDNPSTHSAKVVASGATIWTGTWPARIKANEKGVPTEGRRSTEGRDGSERCSTEKRRRVESSNGDEGSEPFVAAPSSCAPAASGSLTSTILATGANRASGQRRITITRERQRACSPFFDMAESPTFSAAGLSASYQWRVA